MAKFYNEFLKDSEEFECFKLYVECQINGKDFIINEFMLPFMNKIKEGWEFIKQLAKVVGFGLIEIAKLFLNKVIFNIFKFIGFSFTKLFDMVKSGYKYVTDLIDNLAKYIAQSPIVKKSTEIVGWIDAFLDKYPLFKKLGGVALAGILLYIWFNAISFTGDPEFDFNIEDMWKALSNKIGFVDVFGNENGVKMLTFILTNQIAGVTFPYPGASSVQFFGAIIYTLMRAVGKKFVWKPVDKLKEVA
jgi:hypothetical protein